MTVLIQWFLKIFVDVLFTKALIPLVMWLVNTIINIATLEILRRKNIGKGKDYINAQTKEAAQDTFNKLP